MLANLKASGDEAIPAVVRKAAVQYSDTGSWDLTMWDCEPKV